MFDSTNTNKKPLRGSNQSGMRAYNERLVMSLVRKNGALSKTDISKKTELSMQTISVIMRKLESEGFLKKSTPIRGKVGHPSVPILINEKGAYFFGLKIGRRSVELILIDFVGNLIAAKRLAYQYPAPTTILDFCKDSIAETVKTLNKQQIGRIAGLGIAMPFQLWNWASMLDTHQTTMDQWKAYDIQAELSSACPFPVFLQNDTNAACGAELIFGPQSRPDNFLYLYIGFFIGGGIVLNGNLFTGPSGNAGAIGSLPIPDLTGHTGQLIDTASIAGLEKKIKLAKQSTKALWNLPNINDTNPDMQTDWDIDYEILHHWIGDVSDSLAYAITSSIAVIDFEDVVIDGWMPNKTRKTIVSEVRKKISRQNLTGLNKPKISEGSIGHNARAFGAASLPLSERFLVHQSTFQQASRTIGDR